MGVRETTWHVVYIRRVSVSFAAPREEDQMFLYLTSMLLWHLGGMTLPPFKTAGINHSSLSPEAPSPSHLLLLTRLSSLAPPRLLLSSLASPRASLSSSCSCRNDNQWQLSQEHWVHRAVRRLQRIEEDSAYRDLNLVFNPINAHP